MEQDASVWESGSREHDTAKHAIEDYIRDPFILEFLKILDQPFAPGYAEKMRLTKYLAEPSGYRSILSRRMQAFFANNLPDLLRVLQNRNAIRVFLAYRWADNCYHLAQRLRLSRATVRHWTNKLLMMDLLRPHEFREGNESLFRRNQSAIKPHDRRNTVIDILDAIAEDRLKRFAAEEARMSIRNEFDGIPR